MWMGFRTLECLLFSLGFSVSRPPIFTEVFYSFFQLVYISSVYAKLYIVHIAMTSSHDYARVLYCFTRPCLMPLKQNILNQHELTECSVLHQLHRCLDYRRFLTASQCCLVTVIRRTRETDQHHLRLKIQSDPCGWADRGIYS